MTKLYCNQGDTSDVLAVKSSLFRNVDGFSCNLRVIDSADVIVLTKTVTEKDSLDQRFYAYLTPAETQALAVAEYDLIVELSNPTSSPVFNKESHHKLIIRTQKYL